jgi:Kef-type K+ transport system membrane component KefB
MNETISFLIVLAAGLFLSEVFRRLQLPYVVALIIAGIIIGPNGFQFFETNETIDFLGSIGLVFLMFMAGLEIRTAGIKKMAGNITKITLINGLIPFFVGFGIATYFGYGFLPSLLLGTIFISSSIAVIVPLLESRGLLKFPIGKTILAATMFEDVFSLLILSVILQTVSPITQLPLSNFYILVLIALVGLKIAIPEFRKIMMENIYWAKGTFEKEIRLVLIILIAVVVFFEALGMHSIIAGFFAGLVLSESIKSEKLKEKLHTISYGLFIPVFFVIIGANTDLSVFTSNSGPLIFIGAILIGSMGSKFISGFLGGKISGFENRESALIGSSTMPQLSTTLAVAFVAHELKLFDDTLIASLVVLSAVTTLVGPLLVAKFSPDKTKG